MNRLTKVEKLMNYLSIDQSSRGSLRIFFLVIAMIISFHWVACFFYSEALTEYLSYMQKHGTIANWKNEFWIPARDVKFGTTDFYEMEVVK